MQMNLSEWYRYIVIYKTNSKLKLYVYCVNFVLVMMEPQVYNLKDNANKQEKVNPKEK